MGFPYRSAPWFPTPSAAPPPPQVTAHRRGNRNATKFIRFVPVVAQCSKCQKVFQQHSVPRKCAEEECPSFVLRARPQ